MTISIGSKGTYHADSVVIEEISTWGVVIPYEGLIDNDICYFVRCAKWDDGQNGGTWIDAKNFEELKDE